jgi:hypothetical protein
MSPATSEENEPLNEKIQHRWHFENFDTIIKTVNDPKSLRKNVESKYNE